MPELASDTGVGFWAMLSPAVPLLLAGFLCAALPYHQVRKGLMLLAPVAALFVWLSAELGSYGSIEVAGLTLTTMRFDGLSRIFGLAFVIAAFLNGIYALHERSRLSDASALIYAGAGLGAVFAGDLITLFVFWELAAMSSVFLIFARGTTSAVNAGLRYLAIHVASGALLLAGAVIHFRAVGSFEFGALDPNTLGGGLILIAFGVKAAFPLLHNWLQDAYPKATATGAVVLSAFTTKLAIYALARGFAGYEPLIWIGAVMTVFPVFFAVIENDLRRVLSYSINNQLGFMVCAVGIGTPLAINGAAAHAFADIIFKGLLFMSMGAVLHRVGTTRATELGGLFKSMPFTAIFCIIGAMSISAFPLFSAFVTKSMILAAVAHEGHWIVFLMLLFASAGVLEHAGIKIPYFAFFAHDSGRRPKEAPWNMLLAMGIASALCIGIGTFPGWLYSLLPVSVAEHYHPYTGEHILTQMQLLVAAVFAFSFLMRMGVYPPEKRATILDFDWVYRRAGHSLLVWTDVILQRLTGHLGAAMSRALNRADGYLHTVFSPSGALRRTVPNGAMAIWTALILGAALILSLLAS